MADDEKYFVMIFSFRIFEVKIKGDNWKPVYF